MSAAPGDDLLLKARDESLSDRALKIKRDLNLSDVGTHYVTKQILGPWMPYLRGKK